MTNFAVQLTAAIGTTVLLAVFLTAQHFGRRRGPGTDVGLALIQDETGCCEEGCGECGAPMEIDEEPPGDPVQRMLALMSSGAPYVDYGSTTVHQVCLADRREGRAPCAECAPIMAGAS